MGPARTATLVGSVGEQLVTDMAQKWVWFAQKGRGLQPTTVTSLMNSLEVCITSLNTTLWVVIVLDDVMHIHTRCTD